MAAPLRVLPDDALPPGAAPLAEAVEALARGEIVALPTETVYGLAARADQPAALERLARIKGRNPSRTFTWHLPSAEALFQRGPRHPAVLERLARAYWPGPLTLVVSVEVPGLDAVSREGWIGVRVPAHAGTRSLLEACPFPVVATSANPSGAAPLPDAEAVAAAFGADLALVLDGGPPRLGEPSAVLAVGPGRFQTLREGLLLESDLRRSAGLSLLFVCTGNTCRSPMAAALSGELLAERLEAPPEQFGFRVESAGVSAVGGAPAADQAIAVMAEAGIDLSAHRSSSALPQRVRDADRVYCLTAAHRELLLASLPPGEGSHVLLLDPAGRDLPDPFGGSLETYRACAQSMRAMLDARLGDWV